jgi:hypothetical protein
MKRYRIVVREHGSDHDVELIQVDNNPQAVADGLRKKTLTMKTSLFEKGKRSVKVPKYNSVQIIDTST